MIIAPNSISSPSANGAPASTTAQDDSPVNPFCEAHSNDCRTGCFAMRKIIAHIFGRNKACTSQIPDHCWVKWCRKHYQRLRHRMLEQGWIFLQINCLKTQLSRMEKWGEVQNFTIVLQQKFQEELKRNNPAQAPEDEAGLASPNRFLYPYLGVQKSFNDVYAVINAIEKAANEGRIVLLPPLQFLPLIDATLHPPPPIARPRKKRKATVYKKKAHDNMLDNDSDLKTLADSNTTKIIGSCMIRHSSPALISSSSLHTIKSKISSELASRPLPKINTSVAIIVEDNDDAAAREIIPHSTNSEVTSVGPLPIAQPTKSLNDIKHQVTVEANSLSRFSTTENQINQAFEHEIQDSTVDKDKDSAALSKRFTVKNKQSDAASNTLRVAPNSAIQKKGIAAKKLSGTTGLLSSRIKKTHNSRKTRVPAAFSPKIEALPQGSIPLFYKEYGFVGYKIAKPKSDKSAPSSARRSLLHLTTNSHHHAPAAKPTKNTPIGSNLYPTDPTRTYNSTLSDTKDLQIHHLSESRLGLSPTAFRRHH